MNWDQLNHRYSEIATLASYVAGQARSKKPVQLIFVCTHNSRRSQIARALAPFIWQTLSNRESGLSVRAGEADALSSIHAFSGGSEVTSVHPNTIQALLRAGFTFDKGKRKDQDGSEKGAAGLAKNPVYELLDPLDNSLSLFSKLIDDIENPSSNFAAIMVCSHADEACPVVKGADVRISLPFEDPGKFDGTDVSAEAYDRALDQIARDLYCIFSMALIR
ncbi:MAG: hypothetical protein CMN77_20615 [Spirochaetaceae bacterium]|nr:hypothetical protein [Spirochaetaceae bacterium]|tara:strand:+ start:35304 stop:35963 length:660 start_codon:yes stop_codon:yes gene_type:complete